VTSVLWSPAGRYDDAGMTPARTRSTTPRSGLPSFGLELFWPSRRVHTFDEGCH
jgi:hypothetical protein